jgi:hypothetical protein
MVNEKSQQDALRAALGFNESDLELNRLGTLSESQLKSLRAVRFTAVAIVIGIIIFTVFILWLFRGLLSIALQFGIIISAVVFLVGILQSLYRGWNNADLDITRKRVICFEGVVSTEVKTDQSNSESFALKVGETEFVVEKEIFLAFQNGESYRVYCTAYTKNILSAELLQ